MARAADGSPKSIGPALSPQPLSTFRDFCSTLAFAFVAIVMVGIFACRSGMLAIDGQYSTWNLAAFCGQAYGNETIKRCHDGLPRADDYITNYKEGRPHGI